MSNKIVTTSLTAFAAVLAVGALMASAPAFAAKGSGGGSSDRLRLECKSESVIEDASMDARFEARDGRRKFDASFEAAPGGSFQGGDVLHVKVDDQKVGEIELIQIGDVAGDLSLDTNPEDDLPFPQTGPTLTPAPSLWLAHSNARSSRANGINDRALQQPL